MGLVLTRKVGQRIMIGDDIVITVLKPKEGKIRLDIVAPPEVPVHREEVRDQIQTQARIEERRQRLHQK